MSATVALTSSAVPSKSLAVQAFQSKTGKTIQEYLIEVRLKQACEYLRQGFSANHTASLCGYEDVSNFSRMFKKQYGLSPQHWHNNAKSAH